MKPIIKYVIKRITGDQYVSSYDSYRVYFKPVIFQAKQFARFDHVVYRNYKVNQCIFNKNYSNCYNTGETIIVKIEISESGIKVLEEILNPKGLIDRIKNKEYGSWNELIRFYNKEDDHNGN